MCINEIQVSVEVKKAGLCSGLSLRCWMQVDLISVDLFQRVPFRMKVPMVKAALQVSGH